MTAPVSKVLRDLEEARSIGGAVYYPHSIEVGSLPDFELRLDVRTFGPLTVGRIAYNSPVRLETGPLTDGYQFNVPTRGSLDMTIGGTRVRATPYQASVNGPLDASAIRGWSEPGQEMLAVKIARSAVDDALARLLGRVPGEPLRLEPTLRLDRGQGAQLWSLLTVLVDQVQDVHSAGAGQHAGGSLFDVSPLGDSLADSVIVGLLYAHQHNYSEELRAPAVASGSAAIRHAIEYIETHASDPFDIGDVADHVGLSIRALQGGFAKHVGLPPTAYIRSVRLQRARETLQASTVETATVATIAATWGFFNTGRFAAAYRATYGETPSATLRRNK